MNALATSLLISFLSAAFENFPAVTPTNFSITYKTYGGMPPPMDTDGGICFQVNQTSISPNSVTRVGRCSPVSPKRENHVIFSQNFSLDPKLLPDIVLSLTGILSVQLNAEVGTVSNVADDWIAELTVNVGGKNFLFKGLRNSASTAKEITSLFELIESLTP